MRVLILGGTQFVGRHIVEALLPTGHSVSILTRGKSSDELPAQVERLRGDRDKGALGLKALTGRSWDVCVDVSGYTPRQVRPSAERLRDWIRGRDLPPLLSRAREAELIRIALQDGTHSHEPQNPR